MENKKLAGMRVSVLRNAELGDCTTGGVSAVFDSMILVGPGVEEVFEAREGQPYLVLKQKPSAQGPYFYCEPEGHGKEGKWHMAGGNFAWTSDSRMRRLTAGYPIAIHDRVEE